LGEKKIKGRMIKILSYFLIIIIFSPFFLFPQQEKGDFEIMGTGYFNHSVGPTGNKHPVISKEQWDTTKQYILGKTSGNNGTSGILLNFGYLLTDYLEIGITSQLGYSYNIEYSIGQRFDLKNVYTTINYGAGVNLMASYLSENTKAVPFIKIGMAYQFMNSEQAKMTFESYSLGIDGGYKIFLQKNLSLNIELLGSFMLKKHDYVPNYIVALAFGFSYYF
jgi:hypothetical protein